VRPFDEFCGSLCATVFKLKEVCTDIVLEIAGTCKPGNVLREGEKPRPLLFTAQKMTSLQAHAKT